MQQVWFGLFQSIASPCSAYSASKARTSDDFPGAHGPPQEQGINWPAKALHELGGYWLASKSLFADPHRITSLQMRLRANSSAGRSQPPAPSRHPTLHACLAQSIGARGFHDHLFKADHNRKHALA